MADEAIEALYQRARDERCEASRDTVLKRLTEDLKKLGPAVFRKAGMGPERDLDNAIGETYAKAWVHWELSRDESNFWKCDSYDRFLAYACTTLGNSGKDSRRKQHGMEKIEELGEDPVAQIDPHAPGVPTEANRKERRAQYREAVLACLRKFEDEGKITQQEKGVFLALHPLIDERFKEEPEEIVEQYREVVQSCLEELAAKSEVTQGEMEVFLSLHPLAAEYFGQAESPNGSDSPKEIVAQYREAVLTRMTRLEDKGEITQQEKEVLLNLHALIDGRFTEAMRADGSGSAKGVAESFKLDDVREAYDIHYKVKGLLRPCLQRRLGLGPDGSTR